MTRLATLLLAAAGALLSACPSSTPCNTVRDCLSSQRCVNRECIEPSASASAVGEACRGTADCQSGLACQTADQGYAGGFCSVTCTSSSTCAPAACTPVASVSLCTPTCTSDTQCRQGYGCCPTLGNVCVPLGACTPASCQRPVVASALPAGQVNHIGLRKVGDEVIFNVPANTGSVTIVQQAQLATLTVIYKNSEIDNSAVPLRINTPGGAEIYNDATFSPPSSPDGGVDSSDAGAFYGGSTPSTAAFTFPNTSAGLAAGVQAGDWKFVVNDYAYECTFLQGCNDGGTAENTYDVSVVTRAAPGTVMDVAFSIATDAFTEANAATDPSVQRMVQTYKDIFGQVGIGVNAVFHDLSATDKARFGTNISATESGPCSELNQMFTLSGAHPGNTMNVFLVGGLRDASGTAGGTIVGIDGTIPGPSSYNGTVNSGAVVNAADLFAKASPTSCSGARNIGGCGADKVAYIAAHESGHFLGLFHTTEQEGADFDPLNDTPKCPCLNCSSDRSICGSTGPGAPFITADRCVSLPSCGGGDNLMFWFLQSGVSAGTLSTQQSQLIRLNPLVH